MKRRHLERTLRRPSKRPVPSPPQKPCNQNQHSLSYTSLNSYLKEYNLSKKDLVELRHALQKISQYFQPRDTCRHQQQQRLTSPYLQQQQQQRKKSIVDDQQSFLPLYTNEYFIRNGLLNHNDGPEISDEILSSMNVVSSPLSLLPNQKHLFTALTSNFALNQPRCSLSKYHGNEIETDSMIIRTNKVQTWERENILQRQMPIDNSLASPVQPSYSKEVNADHLFPMVKKLGEKFRVRKTSLYSSLFSSVYRYSRCERTKIDPTIIGCIPCDIENNSRTIITSACFTNDATNKQ